MAIDMGFKCTVIRKPYESGRNYSSSSRSTRYQSVIINVKFKSAEKSFVLFSSFVSLSLVLKAANSNERQNNDKKFIIVVSRMKWML